MSKIIDLNTFAEGALSERFNNELQRVLENIADPNTDPKKTRKLTMTVAFNADEKRDVIFTSVLAKLSLAPAKQIEAKLMMDFDGNGKITGAELKSGVKGQTFIDTDGDISTDQGEKIISFKNTNTK
ncbi:replication terminator protein [Peribacillus frigoritolerans]|uniref:replication terminator protein n=1 Tax=Peribacillus frigoritolerans TaxID=450367 RepID=UPI003D04811B